MGVQLMAEYKTIEDLDLAGKKVLVRLDLNVPVKEGKVTDTTRIDASLRTIQYTIENNGIAVLCSHLGRPGGKPNPDLSLKPAADVLAEKLGKQVKLAPDCIGKQAEELANNSEPGEIVLLENLRFHAGEEENNADFAGSLAKIADAYVNDAFGTAHRAHASTYGVPVEMKKQGKDVAAGFLMAKELKIWQPIVSGKGYSVAVIGGAKLKEKMKAVKKFSKKFDRIILGGVVSNVFMKAAGYDIGDSKYLEKGKDYTPDAEELLGPKNIILPSRVIAATTDFKKEGEKNPGQGIGKGHIAADVIPSREDTDAIKKAERIIWFGPMGAYEFGFKEGSLAVVEAINQSKGYAVIGGGDLAAAASGVKAKISTGGGASIQYVTAGKLEALEALKA
ncbi:phosphoglycerate kinase [Candidatus Woesearchaeota archaeon]|nr:phosphoglycerate kinase [Candidatus Woesearchaeota archaeon]